MLCACNRRARRLGRAGTTSLELAVVMASFMWLLLATIDLARFLLTLQSVDFLAAQAARAGVITPSLIYSCSLVSAESLPFHSMPFLDSGTTMCISNTSVSTGGHVVTVSVTSPFIAMTPGLSALTSTTAISVTTQLTY